MTKLKNKFIEFGVTFSAFLSPILMIISIFTNKWLYSIEKVSSGHFLLEKHFSTPIYFTNYQSTSKLFININQSNDWNVTQIAKNNLKKINSTEIKPFYQPFDYIEATYGLWIICRKIGKIFKINYYFSEYHRKVKYKSESKYLR